MDGWEEEGVSSPAPVRQPASAISLGSRRPATPEQARRGWGAGGVSRGGDGVPAGRRAPGPQEEGPPRRQDHPQCWNLDAGCGLDWKKRRPLLASPARAVATPLCFAPALSSQLAWRPASRNRLAMGRCGTCEAPSFHSGPLGL